MMEVFKGCYSLDFIIKQCVAWGGGITTPGDWQAYALGEKSLSTLQELPALSQIPAMQRRRLSPFAKLALHCALTAADDCLSTVPSVFSSRHGDLAKTSKLIEDVAAKEPLSPTNFGLSVHNAVGGLFSIYSGNKAPLTAISAGEDSFFIGLLDALAKLKANDYQQILLVFTENSVPELYKPYIVQDETAIACALLLAPKVIEDDSQKAEKKQATTFSLSMLPQKSVSGKKAKENSCMQVLDFLNFYYNEKNKNQVISINSKRHIWQLVKNAS